MKITYENSWEYTDIHIDLPVPYEDNYQMRMLRANEIPGLAPVKGSGRDGSSRYTYRIRNGISIGKKYETGEMKKRMSTVCSMRCCRRRKRFRPVC